MCFSAPASFTAGTLLAVIGVGTIIKAKKPRQKLFAAVPFLFSLQQFTEGVVWVTLKSGGHEPLQNAAAHIFLTIALVIWPVMVPISVWLMEEVRKKRQILAVLTAMGVIMSLFYAYYLIAYTITPNIDGLHIQYVDEFPQTFVFLFYPAATVLPLFISSVRRMWMFGILIAASYLVTRIFYMQYMTSVWCFFAALMSLAIYWILDESRRRTSPLLAES
jgi:hypothetical protein